MTKKSEKKNSYSFVCVCVAGQRPTFIDIFKTSQDMIWEGSCGSMQAKRVFTEHQNLAGAATLLSYAPTQTWNNECRHIYFTEQKSNLSIAYVQFHRKSPTLYKSIFNQAETSSIWICH